jgi:4-hydroxybutyrate CoA-transferase
MPELRQLAMIPLLSPVLPLKNNVNVVNTGGTMTKIISKDEVPFLLNPGMKVFLQGASGEPTVLTEAIAAKPECAAGVHFVSVLVPSVNSVNPAGFEPTSELTTTFVFGDIATSFAKGQVHFAPLHYSGTTELVLSRAPYDAALIQVSPPDGDGMCNLGISVDFIPAILDQTTTFIAEVNKQMPAVAGSPRIRFDDIAYAVESDRPLLGLNTGEIPVQVAEIGQRVADLIDDGDCFQIGIGKLPAAILSKLFDKRDLGVHSGMISDEVMALTDAGVITSARKTIDQNLLVGGVAVGSPELYKWCGQQENLHFRPASYTHDPRIISQIDNFVSINSVLEVDLTGQANAEMINGRQVSGTGGLVDFIRSARMGNNGRSVLALTATAGKQKKSKIVPQLAQGATVSGLRADVDYVVTEYGAARMKDKDIDARADALIAIADPNARDDLANAWTEIRRKMGPAI